MKSKRIRICIEDRIFYIISGILMSFLLIITLYPMLYVLAASFSSGEAVSSGKVILFPVDFSLDGYKAVAKNPDVLRAYINTIFYTVAGTFINLAMLMFAAYPMSRPDFRSRKIIMKIFAVTMFFGGGLIPTYLLICNLHMLNTVWVMLIPGAFSVYNATVARSFIHSNIPQEMYEAASIDGCNDTQYFFRFILPLSKALLAVMGLFSAVGHWNAYFNALIYLNDRDLMPLQVILREILIMNQVDYSLLLDPELQLKMQNIADVIKYALIVVATAPILCVYPFVQKYFVKGVMVGSLKA